MRWRYRGYRQQLYSDGAGANSQQDFRVNAFVKFRRAPWPRLSITKRLLKGACRIVPPRRLAGQLYAVDFGIEATCTNHARS
jgi:hypothetical protein